MRASPQSDLRAILAGLLVLLLALAGAGRGFAASAGPLRGPGAAAPICHAVRGAPEPSGPGSPVDPDCCSACALFASAILPAAPSLARSSVVPTASAPIPIATVAPETTSRRSPRQAQAPPPV